ncbi:MAG: hypothetical protein R2867_08535 [Caldilineaceae bacterium]
MAILEPLNIFFCCKNTVTIHVISMQIELLATEQAIATIVYLLPTGSAGRADLGLILWPVSVGPTRPSPTMANID